MHLRKQMVLRIGSGELTVSAASREYGVSRNTVMLWIERSQGGSLDQLVERSRRPRGHPRTTTPDIEQELLRLKVARPCWGAKKLLAKRWPGGSPISVRTADRILKRNGMVSSRDPVLPLQRFERDGPNELWQVDFKGLGKCGPSYSPLSVLDDSTRFCLSFDPLASHFTVEVLESLWNTFGTYGLPEAILFDNEPCFASAGGIGPSWLEVRLWLLGIRTLHGRPYHPQTQGKVERFHGTVQKELGARLRQPNIEMARAVFELYIHDYNYERPHESLNMKVPGSVYTPSPRKRPNKIPSHEIPEGAITRRTCPRGVFVVKGQTYRVGRGLGSQTLVLEEELTDIGVYFAGRRLGSLERLKA